jgi:acyl-CoA synthetase (AMP-forming)/AMP-acid ligase II
VLEQLDDERVRILDMYGATELGAATSCRADDAPEVRYETVGRPLAGIDVRLADGEVLVRGPGLSPGYLNLPEQTAASFAGGWFHTGDLGEVDAAGNLRVSGRAKDVVHVGGFSVFPAEVEGFLLTHPDVEQAAVLGVEREPMGEALHAFVVPRPEAELTAPALLRFARASIADYKLPYGITLLPELPLLPSGKPDRAALRRLVAEAAPAGAAK